MNVKIISDSTCDLSSELLSRYDIDIVPLSVTLGDFTGRDGMEVTPAKIYQHVAECKELPKTSAVNTEEYVRVFRSWREKGYSIVHYCISSEFSSCYQNACAAAQEMDEVYVVDSRNLSSGQGLLVLKGAEMARDGASAREIQEECTRLTNKVEASFILDRLDYMHKGGRCSAITMMGANVLHLKPCIEVMGGKMAPTKKYRGRFRQVLLNYVEDRLAGRDDVDPYRIFITHTECDPADVQAVKELLLRHEPPFAEILETDAGSTVTSHCGPNTLGILFMRK